MDIRPLLTEYKNKYKESALNNQNEYIPTKNSFLVKDEEDTPEFEAFTNEVIWYICDNLTPENFRKDIDASMEAISKSFYFDSYDKAVDLKRLELLKERCFDEGYAFTKEALSRGFRREELKHKLVTIILNDDKSPLFVDYPSLYLDIYKELRVDKDNSKLEEILGHKVDIVTPYLENIENIMPERTISKAVCFTGKRPKDLLGYENREGYEKIKDKIKEAIIPLIENEGVTTFISGGAQGFDQLAFWAVNDLKSKYPQIENVVYAPFRNQASRWAKEGLFGQDEYNSMLEKADRVRYVYDRNYESPSDLFDRNHAMVDDANIVVALYPDNTYTMEEGNGGTAECMRYAKSNDKEILQMAYGDNLKKYFGIEEQPQASARRRVVRRYGKE